MPVGIEDKTNQMREEEDRDADEVRMCLPQSPDSSVAPKTSNSIQLLYT